MASELGADVALCKRAGLLHDIGKSVDHEVEGTHITIGGDLAKKYRESPAVIHCILAHHGDIEANTIEAVLVQAATPSAARGPAQGANRSSIISSGCRSLRKLPMRSRASRNPLPFRQAARYASSLSPRMSTTRAVC